MHYEERLGAREFKFLVTPARAAEIRAWAKERLSPDSHAGSNGTYRVTSLYFDTAAFDVFHRRGSYGRAKYRVRRYDDAPSVYVERKMRTECLVSKRRSVIEAGEVSRIAGAGDGDWSGGWFQRRLRARQLGPVCSISYVRTAMAGQQPDGSLVRLTLDEELCATRVHSPAFGEPYSGIRFAGGDQILELKFLGDMPALFKELLGSFTLNRSSVSKYRTAAAALGLAARHA